MQKPFMRIPYTGPLPPPIIIPRSANTPSGAIAALSAFLTAPLSSSLKPAQHGDKTQTVLLTGAGISVASGLADYRGTNGTYTLNKTYRPIYYHEFITNHEARKRYWARSFLGWTNLFKAKPNHAHWAVKQLGEMGVLRSVITQSMWINTERYRAKLAETDASSVRVQTSILSIRRLILSFQQSNCMDTSAHWFACHVLIISLELPSRSHYHY